MNKLAAVWAVLASIMVSLVPIAQQSSAQTTGRFTLIETDVVQLVRASDSERGGKGEWRETAPSMRRGIVLSVSATFEPGLSEALSCRELTVEFGNTRVFCLGMTEGGPARRGGRWVLADWQKQFFPTLTAAPTVETSLLFEIPLTVTELSLCYRGPEVLERILIPDR
jgi:hypothetical protein